MTISLCIRFTSQPVRTNSVASQSSSSGCVGQLALGAEVLGGLDEPGAEEHLPDAVDRHAGRQRVVGIDEPRREAEPVAAARRSAAAAAGRHAGRTFAPWLVVLAADQHVRLARRRHLLHHHRRSGSRPQNFAPLPREFAARPRAPSRIAAGACFGRKYAPQLVRLGRRLAPRPASPTISPGDSATASDRDLVRSSTRL